ncbi:tRNA pseudouridine(38-40) synthase TruA [Enterococcus sp. LJL98]
MRNIKLTIEYDGRRYLGWQRLGDSEKTIQGKIEGVLKQILETEAIEIIGSGRTDAGAHARGQVANFKTENEMALDKMTELLNRYLPRDIIAKKVEEVPERFHSRYNAKGKKYSYYVWDNVIPSAFEGFHSFYYPQTLDMEKMEAACQKLMGRHDFIGFSSLKKSKKSTVRTVEEIAIQREGDLLHFTFVGEGFLYNMVRIMMGTILEIGAGKIDLSVIDDVFEKKVRADAGMTVPAQGLFLDEVYYGLPS